MTEDHITDFMRRHAPTLRSLQLADIFLRQGAWELTFRQFKATLDLQEVELISIFGVYDLSYQEEDEVVFDPQYHLLMSGFTHGNIHVRLGDREDLATSLEKFLLEKNGDDWDPLKDWGQRCAARGSISLCHTHDLSCGYQTFLPCARLAFVITES